MLFLQTFDNVFQRALERAGGFRFDGDQGGGELEGLFGVVVQAPGQVGGEGVVAAASPAGAVAVGEFLVVGLSLHPRQHALGVGDDDCPMFARRVRTKRACRQPVSPIMYVV